MTKMQRDKGQRGERQVIEEIRKVFGVKYARTPLSGGMDIKGDIRKPFKQEKTICDMFHWEVKYQEHLNIWKSYEQAENDARKDPTNPQPLVAFRRNHSEWFAMLRLDMFLEILYELQSWRQSEGAKGQDGFNLLSPLGSPPDVQKGKQSFADWVVEKDKQIDETKAKKKKQKELKEKYGNRS